MSDEKDARRAGPLSLFRGNGNGHSSNGNGNGNGNGHKRNGQSNGRILIPEEYARLHADIERASSPSRCFVVGVTSAVYGEGKTTVAMNLAGIMARNSTQRVALIDCNLRHWD